MFAHLRGRDLLALLAVYVIWGSTYYGMRLAFRELPQLSGSGLRYFLAGLCLLIVLSARGSAWPSLKQWLLAIPVGTLMFLAGNGVIAIVGRHIGSGLIAVVCATMPLWLAVIGQVRGERQTGTEWIAMCIGVLGVVVLAWRSELRANPLMTALLLLAPAGWAFGSTLARHWPLAPGLMSGATQMMAGGAVMMICGFLFHDEHLPTQVSGTAIAAFFYLLVFGSLIGFSAYTYLLRNVRPALAVSYAYVNPVFAVLLGATIGGETIKPEAWIATFLIVAAVVLATRPPGPVSGSTTSEV
jgi:drug/metabolite transporter (DMT)-like permease